MTIKTLSGIPTRTVTILLALLILSCYQKGIRKSPPYSEIISKDTVWSGEVPVDGVVLVRKGATLKLEPGCVVSFTGKKIVTEDEHEGFSGSGIKVEGKIVAEGTRENPVIFTAAQPEGPGSWDRIYFAFSKGNILKYTRIEYGGYAVHAHFSEIEISHTLFRKNIEGVRLGGSRVAIDSSVFTGNTVRGINFKESKNRITGCAVYDNGVGIFLHSKDSQSVMENNAIYNNKRYDLRLGDLHAGNVDVTRNWWGSSDPVYIGERIYDGSDQDGLGRAKFAPFLRRPAVTVASVKGFLVHEREEVQGEVFALLDLEEGFSDARAVGSSTVDDSGDFEVFLPPGRYFIYGRTKYSGIHHFGFTGNNPLSIGPFEQRLIAIPLVEVEGSESKIDCAGAGYTGVSVSVTRNDKPVADSFVYLYPASAIDIRGPGISSGISSSGGRVDISASPGEYLVLARKRSRGRSLGMVHYGGLFGISPHLPVTVRDGCVTVVRVPLFVKEGIMDEEGEFSPDGGKMNAFVFLEGGAAKGYIVYFYRDKRPVGRPDFVSGVVNQDGSFSIENIDDVGDGEYFAFLRKTSPGLPGSSEKIEAGPLRVRFEGGVIVPSELEF